MPLGLEIRSDIPPPTERDTLPDDDHREIYDLIRAMNVGDSILLHRPLVPRFSTDMRTFMTKAFGADSYTTSILREGIRFWRVR